MYHSQFGNLHLSFTERTVHSRVIIFTINGNHKTKNKMSNAIYIETTAQAGGMLIAFPVGDLNSHQPYRLVKVHYGREAVRDILDSKYFTKHNLSELPSDITEMFEYKKVSDHAYCFYKEIVQGDDFKKQATECMRISMEVIDEYNILLQNLPASDIVSNKLPEIKQKLQRVLEISKQINK